MGLIVDSCFIIAATALTVKRPLVTNTVAEFRRVPQLDAIPF